MKTVMVSAVSLIWFGNFAFAKMNAELSTREYPIVTFRSGNVTYQEALIDGRWVGLRWQIGEKKQS